MGIACRSSPRAQIATMPELAWPIFLFAGSPPLYRVAQGLGNLHALKE
jgi:hypothetical protein